MVALLRQAARPTRCGAATHVRERARRLLERAQMVERAEPRQSLVEPLSQRELEVLRLLDSELTGPEIARELYVTRQHPAHPHQAHLHQARRRRPGQPPCAAPTSAGSSVGHEAPGCHHVSHIMW